MSHCYRKPKTLQMRRIGISFMLLLASNPPIMAQKLRESRNVNREKIDVASATIGTKNRIIPPGTLFSNKLGMRFRFCPPGSIHRVQQDERESGNDLVVFSSGFFIGETEVTQDQYESIAGVNKSFFKASGPNAPVDSVELNDITSFIAGLNQRERGIHYRLPTEQEWTYAFRAGQPEPNFTSMDGTAWLENNAKGMTHPAGQKSANSWGLCDMLGNVAEYCTEQLQKDATQRSASSLNGTFSSVLVGGSWNKSSTCYPFRVQNCSTYSNNEIGFRLVLVMEDAVFDSFVTNVNDRVQKVENEILIRAHQMEAINQERKNADLNRMTKQEYNDSIESISWILAKRSILECAQRRGNFLSEGRKMLEKYSTEIDTQAKALNRDLRFKSFRIWDDVTSMVCAYLQLSNRGGTGLGRGGSPNTTVLEGPLDLRIEARKSAEKHIQRLKSAR